MATPTAMVQVTIQTPTEAEIKKAESVLRSMAGSNDYQIGPIASSFGANGDIVLTADIKGTGNATAKGPMLAFIQNVTKGHFLNSTVSYNDGKTSTTHSFEGLARVDNAAAVPPAPAPMPTPASPELANIPATDTPLPASDKVEMNIGTAIGQSGILGKPMARMTFVLDGQSTQSVDTVKNKLQQFANNNSYNFGAFNTSKDANGDTIITVNMSAEGAKATSKAAFITKVETFTKEHKFLSSNMTYGYEGSKTPTEHSFTGVARIDTITPVGGVVNSDNGAMPIGGVPSFNTGENPDDKKIQVAPPKFQVVPKPKSSALVANKASASDDPRTALPTASSGGEYTVVKGDTLTHIAAQKGTTVAELVKLNGIKNPDLILTGQKLKLPSGGAGYGDKLGADPTVKIEHAMGGSGLDNSSSGASAPIGSPSYTDPNKS